jgi:5-amino-6-(5-phosphoribosylamino)uracil reductase/diaminohydroxyphosphoribosylaminopyrimidine deaminase/5-amino-6-(5-phosphoribosylamino)uracil reductase
VPLAPAEQAVFRCYLPFLAGLARARAMDHAVVSGHLTTTLDGRIAPPAGPGLWLGNGADRRHTHRLRALHDAVLVGRRTLERDDPLLTVREVTGPTPRRVVLDPSLALLRRDGGYRAFAAPGAILLHAAGCPCPASPPPGVTLLPVAAAPAVGGEGGEGSVLPPDGILAALAGVGIHSVFVEGGGQTLMRFLAAGRMDLLHLHLAPRLLGAGVPAVALPEGAGVPDLRYLLTPFLLDGEVLLECQPALPP